MFVVLGVTGINGALLVLVPRIAIAACGVGLVLNSFIGLKAMPRLRRTYEDELAAALTWAPFALMFVTTLAVRAALVLPIEPRANWVFRMTEHEAARVQ